MSTLKNTEGEDSFDLNSPLSSLNGKNPFRVDDSYFEAFSAKLNDRIADLEELQADAPTLASIPKYNPFELPTGYFDEFPTQLQEILSKEKTRISLKEWIFQLIRPNFVLPVLTTIIVAVAAIQVVNKQVQSPKASMTADFSIEEQLYPIDEATLVDLLSSNTIENELKQADADEPIANYLIDNNVDESVLNTDLNTADHENK